MSVLHLVVWELVCSLEMLTTLIEQGWFSKAHKQAYGWLYSSCALLTLGDTVYETLSHGVGSEGSDHFHIPSSFFFFFFPLSTALPAAYGTQRHWSS